jgi:hypothetical protein
MTTPGGLHEAKGDARRRGVNATDVSPLGRSAALVTSEEHAPSTGFDDREVATGVNDIAITTNMLNRLAPSRLPTGGETDAKNTLQSHSILALATADHLKQNAVKGEEETKAVANKTTSADADGDSASPAGTNDPNQFYKQTMIYRSNGLSTQRLEGDTTETSVGSRQICLETKIFPKNAMCMMQMVRSLPFPCKQFKGRLLFRIHKDTAGENLAILNFQEQVGEMGSTTNFFWLDL